MTDVGLGLRPAGPAGADAVRRRGAARQARERAVEARDGPDLLHAGRADHRACTSTTSRSCCRCWSGWSQAGNTVVVIEHNLDVVKTADWVIDLGPEGGGAGGRIVVAGTPEEVAAHPTSYTGAFLAPILGVDRPAPAARPATAFRPGRSPHCPPGQWGTRHLVRMRPAVPGILSVKRAAQRRRRAGRGGDRGFGVRPAKRAAEHPGELPGRQLPDPGRRPGLRRGPVAVGDHGQRTATPSVTYLLLAPQLKKGAIPPPLLAEHAAAAVRGHRVAGRRHLDASERHARTHAEGGKGTATEIADKDGQYDGQSTVAMAVDPEGFHHVVWSTPSGLFYAQDSKVQLAGRTRPRWPSTAPPTQIVKDAASGASIAVSDDGTPWVAFIAGGTVEARQPERLDVERPGRGPGAPGRPARANRTAIAVVSGNPIVAFPGAAGVTVATRPSTAPTPGTVDRRAAGARRRCRRRPARWAFR